MANVITKQCESGKLMMTIRTTTNKQFEQLESWLNILINTYTDHPSDGLAKVINYYIERLLRCEDILRNNQLCCEYMSMKRFWLWQCQNGYKTYLER